MPKFKSARHHRLVRPLWMYGLSYAVRMGQCVKTLSGAHLTVNASESYHYPYKAE